MKKYTESDIESMLSKTEKTDPKFERRVIFPVGKVKIIHRRRLFIPIAACLTVVALSVMAIFSVPVDTPDLPHAETEPDYAVSKPNESSPFSAVMSDDDRSENFFESDDESQGFSDFSDTTDESRAPHTSQDVSNPDSSVFVKIDYPMRPILFENAEIAAGQTAEEYIDSTYVKYLEAKNSLEIYNRYKISDSEKKRLISAFLNDFGFDIDASNSVVENGIYTFADSISGKVIEISEYGDWKIYIDLTLDAISAANEDECINYISNFVSENINVFKNHEYEYSYRRIGKTTLIDVFNKEHGKGVLSDYPKYTFELAENETGTSIVSVKYFNGNAESHGKYKTRLYDSAIKSLFADKFCSANDFKFSDGDTYSILGYDVRYVCSPYEALVCPYYVFVVNVNHDDGSSSVQTLFVPAIDDRHLN